MAASMSTQRKRPPGSGRGSNAGLASVTALPGTRGQGKRLVAERIAAARAALGMTPAEFAEYVAPLLSGKPAPDMIERWEQTGNAPAEVYAVLDGMPGAGTPLLESVPASFPAAALAGLWVTAYQFMHGGKPHYHADVAHVTAGGDRLVRAVNHPPDPRTQGRASPFRNEAEGCLFGRHLIGTWRNTSDTRYYGAFELAVLPGETVMDGFYTGVASDIAVSAERWRWVRLEDADPAGLILGHAPALHELVMSRTQDDPPLTVDDIREDA
jgi:hypothetical protein